MKEARLSKTEDENDYSEYEYKDDDEDNDEDETGQRGVRGRTWGQIRKERARKEKARKDKARKEKARRRKAKLELKMDSYEDDTHSGWAGGH